MTKVCLDFQEARGEELLRPTYRTHAGRNREATAQQKEAGGCQVSTKGKVPAMRRRFLEAHQNLLLHSHESQRRTFPKA